MTSDQPKVSFIPKSSLVRDESFLERPRPRSLLSFLAVVGLIATVGSYIGLYFFDYTINQQAAQRSQEVKSLQEKFSQSPEIEKAKVFQARAELARELLDSHTVVSPVFDFLAANTLASIYYSSFAFVQTDKGLAVTLNGEAPSYASLAYQSDILDAKAKELSNFSFTNLSLTNFGSVSFVLNLTFVPGYLSYTKERETRNITTVPSVATTTPTTTPSVAPVSKPASPVRVGTTTTTIILPVVPTLNTGTTTSSLDETIPVAVSSSEMAPQEMPPASVAPAVEAAPQQSFWSIFKFW